jgi:predicted SpoU family rRNA methylase
MKATKRLTTKALFTALFLAAALILTGCEGSEAKKEVEETVHELSGAGIVEKGENLKQQIRDLNAEDVQRIQQDLSRGVYGEK